METLDLKKYIDKKVRVIFTDGQTLHGDFTSIVPDYDTDSGKDEMELYIGGAFIQTPIDEVKSISLYQV